MTLDGINRIAGKLITVSNNEAVSIEMWYDRYTKSWVVQYMDKNGHQVGEADYVYTKNEAQKLVDNFNRQLKRGTIMNNISDRINRIAGILTAYTELKENNEARPARMKKPKVSPQAHRHYKEYIQDLFRDILVDKYGRDRGEKNFEWFISQPNRAMFTVGQNIQDEKAQMYMDLGEELPHEYFHESYFDVWKRWMARKTASTNWKNEVKNETLKTLLQDAIYRNKIEESDVIAGKYIGVTADKNNALIEVKVVDSIDKLSAFMRKNLGDVPDVAVMILRLPDDAIKYMKKNNKGIWMKVGSAAV